MLRDGFKAMTDTGAQHIIAIHDDPEFRAILKRMGWESHGDFINTLEVKDIKHGIPIDTVRRRREGGAGG